MDKQELMSGYSVNNMTGMPVYSIESGKKLGSIKDVLFDGEQNRVLGYTMEENGIFSPHRVFLPFENIKSVGEDALMVASSQVLIPERDAPGLSQIVRKQQELSRRTVVTESGNILGSVTDILVDATTGRAIGYEVSRGLGSDINRGRGYVKAPNAFLLGRDAVIVSDDTEYMLESQQAGGLTGAYESAAEKGRGLKQQAEAYTQEQEISMSQGKIAGKDVYDDEGNLIVGKGEVISEDIIAYAVHEDKMHQVALAAGVGGASRQYGRAEKTSESFWQETKEGASNLWSNLTELTRESASRAARKRAVADQKRFLIGKIAANDVMDNSSRIAIKTGDVITPLVLDTLDRQGLLENVTVKPLVVEDTSAVHVVMEKPEEHKEHKTRAHI